MKNTGGRYQMYLTRGVFGQCVTTNWIPLLVALAVVVTVMLPLVAPAGTGTLIAVGVQLVIAPALPLKDTDPCMAPKLVPVMVMGAAIAPLVDETLLISGAGAAGAGAAGGGGAGAGAATVPVTLTFCGESAALSVIISVPLPILLVAAPAGGAIVTVIVQDPFGAKVSGVAGKVPGGVPQVFVGAVAKKLVASVEVSSILVMVSGAFPTLVNVTVCGCVCPAAIE